MQISSTLLFTACRGSRAADRTALLGVRDLTRSVGWCMVYNEYQNALRCGVTSPQDRHPLPARITMPGMIRNLVTGKADSNRELEAGLPTRTKRVGRRNDSAWNRSDKIKSRGEPSQRMMVNGSLTSKAVR